MDKLKRKPVTLFVITLVIFLAVITSLSFIPQDSQATKLIVVASTTFIPLDKPVN